MYIFSCTYLTHYNYLSIISIYYVFSTPPEHTHTHTHIYNYGEVGVRLLLFLFKLLTLYRNTLCSPIEAPSLTKLHTHTHTTYEQKYCQECFFMFQEEDQEEEQAQLRSTATTSPEPPLHHYRELQHRIPLHKIHFVQQPSTSSTTST